jgi:hypothetical protein
VEEEKHDLLNARVGFCFVTEISITLFIIHGFPTTVDPYLSSNPTMTSVANRCDRPMKEVGFQWWRWVFDGRRGEGKRKVC